jgi:hypothetical protein
MKVSPLRQETEAGSGPAAAHKPAQEQASVMIEIDHVTQVFQTSARMDHLALLDISFSIEDGAFVSILGPSRLRQVDAALYRRRPLQSDARRGEDAGQGDHWTGTRSRTGVSGVSPCFPGKTCLAT